MDARTQEQFIRHWTAAQSTIAAYVRGLIPDRQQAEDLLQDIAVQLMNKFDGYDPSRPFVAWALGFAKFAVMNSKRTRARSFITYQPDILDAVTEVYEERLPDYEHKKAALNQCLELVKGRNRRMLVMRYWNDMKPKAIAKKMGMRSGAVRVALSRTRNALLKCIKQHVSSEGDRL